MGSDSSPTRVRRPDGAGAVNAAVPDDQIPASQRGLRRRGSGSRASISPATDLDWGQPVSTTQPVSSRGRAGDRGLVDELQLRADSRRRPAATPVRFTQAPSRRGTVKLTTRSALCLLMKAARPNPGRRQSRRESFENAR